MSSKKIVPLFFILFCLSSILANDTSLSPSDFSVVVDTHAPEITILSPLNTTYNNAEPILVNYTIRDPTLAYIWYSLNEAANITITEPFNLTLGEGFQHLILYANDSFNRTNFSEVYFTTEYTPLPFCGDGDCGSGEDCENCPEDCDECEPSSSSSNGGGDDPIDPSSDEPLTADFSISQSQLRVALNPGENLTETIIIKNTGEKVIKITIDAPLSLINFMNVSEKSFFLKKDSEYEIQIKFNILETAEFGVYTGKILLSGLGIEKTLPITIEIEAEDSLFDLILKILPDYLTLHAGEKITAEITALDIGEAGEVDVTIKSGIKDFEGKTLIEESNTYIVNQELTIKQTFTIPEETNPGRYVLYAILNYQGKSATASQDFEITKDYSLYLWIIITLIIVAILIMVGSYFIARRKTKKPRRKVKSKLKTKKSKKKK